MCSALDLCKTFNKPSPLDDDATVDESKKLDVNIEDISVLISARVPILKITGVTLSEGALVFERGNVSLQRNDENIRTPTGTPPIDVDVCVENPLGIYNTALLKCYADFDPRVRPLIMIVKYWAKQRAIKDASNATLSSYCYVLMVIFYLQQIGILPCLQDPELVGEKWKRDLVEGCDVSACLDVDEARTFFQKQKGIGEDDDDDERRQEEEEEKEGKSFSVRSG